MRAQRVLLLGPDDDARRALHLLLDRAGREVAAMADVEQARRYLAASECDAVLAAGEVAAEVARISPRPPVVAIAKPRDTARSLLEAGVDDIVAEPLDELAVALALRHVAAIARTRARADDGTPGSAAAIVGDGAAMQKLRALVERVAATRSTVLILGESGTGKELVARAIHDASPRRGKRFVAVNCAAIPAPLLESELFGHVRGAFTDAVRDRAGLFVEADGGTLFLDEIGELPLALQSKLLRVLQEGEVRRVGDTAPIKVDARVVAATLRDLAEDVAAGRFREDLYYRLHVLPVHVPPLRERTEDIPQLARFFAVRHAERHGREPSDLDDGAIDALRHQPWPGNVRELENTIERAVVLADGAIDRAFLATVMKARVGDPAADADLSIKKATRAIEQDLIRKALGATRGNRTKAAELLEISHRSLLYKLKEYGIR